MVDDLVTHFGEQKVFIDVAGIEAGRDFRKAIEESLPIVVCCMRDDISTIVAALSRRPRVRGRNSVVERMTVLRHPSF